MAIFALSLLSFSTTQLNAIVIAENFDGPGSDLSGTIFTDIGALTTAVTSAVREPLVAGIGAPQTSPGLPINVGGDKELRFFKHNQGIGGGWNMEIYTNSLPAELTRDIVVEAIVGFGRIESTGTGSAGVMLRSSHVGVLDNAYRANLGTSGLGTSINFSIQRAINGVVTAADILASGGAIPASTGTQSYRIRFKAVDDELTADLWRISATAGSVVETHLQTLSAIDSTYASGQVGLYGFTATTNSVFYDDVMISLVPEPSRLLLLAAAGILAAFRRRRWSRCS